MRVVFAQPGVNLCLCIVVFALLNPRFEGGRGKLLDRRRLIMIVNHIVHILSIFTQEMMNVASVCKKPFPLLLNKSVRPDQRGVRRSGGVRGVISQSLPGEQFRSVSTVPTGLG
jgi:hypothetical protein